MSEKSIRPNFNVETSVSGYDMLSAFLVSSIMLVGFLAALLFCVWLTMIIDFSGRKPIALVEYEEPFGDEKPEGFEDDLFEPGVEEFPEVDVPQLKDALEAVTDAVSSVKAALEARDGDAAQMGAGSGFGSRDGGPGTGGGDVIPEHKRWQIEYSAKNLTEYSKQLRHFNIDIGVIGQSTNKITRLVQPGGSGQVVNSSRAAEKKSLYFVPEKIRLRKWDEVLVKQKSISTTGAFTVQFYPMATRQQLRDVEIAYLTKIGRQLREVRRTVFKISPAGGGYRYELKEMNFRL